MVLIANWHIPRTSMAKATPSAPQHAHARQSQGARRNAPAVDETELSGEL
eukprot:CAMPEP_0119466934 /NCGR_PEP_ID=MMETSP1344-20130328/1361_1 /TAXON_ID=236787 /ORGANISM="Florenciella parvula, Strain CCMP2471" /LENGTH=49 /DNA_ID=CAMNT_0007499275 /DNA_START=9 /DNA_END=158 /DNA_ORIENTATION=-